jgi:hypothetical protein
MSVRASISKPATVAAMLVLLVVGVMAVTGNAQRTVTSRDPAAQAVQFTIQFTTTDTAHSGSYTVPTGKRLVLQYMTARADGIVAAFTVTTVVNTQTATYDLEASSGPYGHMIRDNAGNVRIYADGGTDVILRAVASAGVQVFAAFSGYFIDYTG